MYNDYSPNGVVFLGINVEEDLQTVIDWQARFGIPYTLLMDTDATVFRSYGGNGYPFNVILDSSGNTAYTQAGFDEAGMRQVIEDLLQLPPPRPINFSVMHDGSGNFEFNWEDEMRNNVVGYRIYYGAWPMQYTDFIEVADPNARSYQASLPPQLYFFSVRSYDQNGQESPSSNEVQAGEVVPVCDMLLSQSVYQQYDTMRVDFYLQNNLNQPVDVVYFVVLQIAGQFHFMEQNGAFTTVPTGIPKTLAPLEFMMKTALDVRFYDPLPEICGTWWLLMTSGDGQKFYYYDYSDFCLK